MSETVDLRVAANGRLVLPKALREAIELSDNTKVIATLEGDEVRLSPIINSARRAQELYRRHATTSYTVDDFLEERKREADADERGLRGDAPA